MKISLQETSALPIRAQLVEQLKYHIEIGTWPPGTQLPTVRELAAALRINYNTVRAAYQELEEAGYLTARQGRGTFVADDAPQLASTGLPEGEETVLDIIDEALARAQALGLDAGAFVRLVSARAHLLSGPSREVRLLFVECNRADAAYYGEQVARETGVRPDLMLVGELGRQAPGALAAYDLIATTLFHIAEVKAVVEARGVPAGRVLGLMVEPSYFEVIREIARLPRGTRIGLVCSTPRGARSMARSLVGVGAQHLTLLTAGVRDPARLRKVFQAAKRVYVSRQALQQHGGDWPGPAAVYPYEDDLSSAAMRLLRRRIAAVRRTRAAKREEG